MAGRKREPAVHVYVVTVGAPYRGLNLREGPGKGFAVLKTVPNGTEIVQEGRTKNGWVPTGEGWVDSQYLRRKDV